MPRSTPADVGLRWTATVYHQVLEAGAVTFSSADTRYDADTSPTPIPYARVLTASLKAYTEQYPGRSIPVDAPLDATDGLLIRLGAAGLATVIVSGDHDDERGGHSLIFGNTDEDVTPPNV